jgi:predicted dehydrogenase
LIFVASTPDVHYKVLKLCVTYDIAVFVEKPPVKNLSELNDIAALNKHSTLIGVGMNFSYSDSHHTVESLIEDEEFGNITSIMIEHLSSKPVEPFWNFDSIIESFLLAQLIHPLDYILRLGGTYSNINVFCSKNIQPFYLSLVIEFDSGVIGHIKSGTFYPRFKHHLEITSDKGNIINVGDLSKVELTIRNFNVPFSLNSSKCNVVNHKSPLKSGYSSAGFSSEISSFIDAFLNKKKFKTSLNSTAYTYKALGEIHEKILCITRPNCPHIPVVQSTLPGIVEAVE